MKPKLILADEPTGNLDSENSELISKILFDYVSDEKASLIMVTHDNNLANQTMKKLKLKMVELISSSSFKLYLKYALRDLSRSYSKILSIIITLFISLFILSSILTIEDSLETEIKNNSKLLLGGDIEIDYNQVKGNLDLVDKVKEFATVSQMVEFSTMVSTIDKEKNKSSFTRVKSVDANYPLYGEVYLNQKVRWKN